MNEDIALIDQFNGFFDGVEKTTYLIEAGRPCQYAVNNNPCTFCKFWDRKSYSDKTLNTEIKNFKNGNIEIISGGSFLDDLQFPKDTRNNIYNLLGKVNFDTVTFESRPEYITKERINELKKELPNKNIEIAIGLETIDDKLKKTINKGFKTKAVFDAIDLLSKENMKSKLYLLYNYKKEIDDKIMKTLKEIAKKQKAINKTITIGFETTYGQNADIKKIVAILKTAKKLNLNIYVALSGEGIAKHPLEKYNKEFTEFNKTQKIAALEGIS